MGLLLIVVGRRALVKTITSFTVAHSITLAIATLGYASAPLPPLNTASKWALRLTQVAVATKPRYSETACPTAFVRTTSVLIVPWPRSSDG